MNVKLQRVTDFIQEHHVMSLATAYNGDLSVCSLFYIYDRDTHTFIVASSEKTTHIEHINNNNIIAGNILLEVDEVSKIKGLQFAGIFTACRDENACKLYYEAYPYALVIPTKLWRIKINYFKMTDNTLSFGKKIIISQEELSL